MHSAQPKLVVLTGAGMSAESGIPTFRGNGGLWENHRVEDVATPAAWARDRELVLRFYNERRRKMWSCEPNAGHFGLAALESQFHVEVITQNIDNLHERAGSSRVLHLHGELSKARSTLNPQLVYDIGERDILLGDKCERGSQLRPHIVWFGEDVPLFSRAAEIVGEADLVVIIGTSMQVYPAASLIDFAPRGAKVFLIDPQPSTTRRGLTVIPMGASDGVAHLARLLQVRS
ncbi:MAG: Sir2 family NAD-dependent protein deacetylase [Nibricoccus sp.]